MESIETQAQAAQGTQLTFRAASGKIERWLRAIFIGVKEGRTGECNYKNCSTPDGKIGHACCRLEDYLCRPFLQEDGRCLIHDNLLYSGMTCPYFPMGPKDIKDVINCGYCWPNGQKNNGEQQNADRH